ncbi:MAG: hypothetical protein KA072_12595 [Thermoanaerobaculaceae bacterium]|nr:hypothetical protein [Thermoanaerobaculaceae bacterium]MDI9620259.1 hypothetical protein [Acidobacteriota bacterium]NLH11235.1 hypothetical protein [Holophagae bacterium]HPW56456.1 hypothetical protein [Thermoanaerobaculaceae bacterium]
MAASNGRADAGTPLPGAPVNTPVTIRSEWLRSHVRERGGRLFVITGIFVVG